MFIVNIIHVVQKKLRRWYAVASSYRPVFTNHGTLGVSTYTYIICTLLLHGREDIVFKTLPLTIMYTETYRLVSRA